MDWEALWENNWLVSRRAIPNPQADEYPDVLKFASAVFPSKDDDVVTSPYNSFVPVPLFIISPLAS